MILRMTDLDLHHKRVIIREDFNVPIQDGKISNDRRLQAAIPTIQMALKQNAKILIVSHLGRPKEGVIDSTLSLAPIAKRLAELLNHPVRFVSDWVDGVEIAPGEIVLGENVRFLSGEKENKGELAKKMAALCDIFVMDAFGTAHRAEASTCGLAKYAPIACGGPLLMAELDALDRALSHPKRPLLAIVGGSKVSSKLTVLEHLLEKVDQLIVGGGIANTFIAAAGYDVGKSLYEPDLIAAAKSLQQQAKQKGTLIPLPKDVVVADQVAENAIASVRHVDDINANDRVLDIGPATIAELQEIIKQAGTIIWNGPLGVFEFPAFSDGTKAIAQAIAASKAYSLAGGGETLAAIDQFHVGDKISYISTGGGAFLEYIEGKKLPVIEILENRAHSE